MALLRVTTPAVGVASEQDWYAHLVWVDRRKCLLVTHAGTLFSVFMPNVTAAGLRPIGPPVVSAIETALRAEGLPVDTLGELDGAQPTQQAPTPPGARTPVPYPAPRLHPCACGSPPLQG